MRKRARCRINRWLFARRKLKKSQVPYNPQQVGRARIFFLPLGATTNVYKACVTLLIHVYSRSVIVGMGGQRTGRWA